MIETHRLIDANGRLLESYTYRDGLLISKTKGGPRPKKPSTKARLRRKKEETVMNPGTPLEMPTMNFERDRGDDPISVVQARLEQRYGPAEARSRLKVMSGIELISLAERLEGGEALDDNGPLVMPQMVWG